MTEEELVRRTKRLIRRFDQMQIIGAGGEWAGNSRQGFMFNPRPRRTGETPTVVTGACCIGADCSITTEANCIAAGGTYQGDNTVCTPNPCATGACCFGLGCFPGYTQAQCEADGGVYQGDGSTCSPDPCACPSIHVVGSVTVSGTCSTGIVFTTLTPATFEGDLLTIATSFPDPPGAWCMAGYTAADGQVQLQCGANTRTDDFSFAMTLGRVITEGPLYGTTYSPGVWVLLPPGYNWFKVVSPCSGCVNTEVDIGPSSAVLPNVTNSFSITQGGITTQFDVTFTIL